MNLHKEAGLYDLTPRVLKKMALKVTPFLTMIYRRSYLTGNSKSMPSFKERETFQSY